MLADRMNYLYFTFITPIVQEFEKINSLFQQTNGDHMKFPKNCYFIMRVYIEDFMTKIGRVKAWNVLILVLSSTRKLVFI